jgi:hypothetical protein
MLPLLTGKQRRTPLVILWGICLYFLPLTGTAQGIAVGDPIPGFQLADQSGAPQSFASIRGPKGAMLVFYRSADW